MAEKQNSSKNVNAQQTIKKLNNITQQTTKKQNNIKNTAQQTKKQSNANTNTNKNNTNKNTPQSRPQTKKQNANNAKKNNAVIPRPVFSPTSHEEIAPNDGWRLPTRNGFTDFIQETFVYKNAPEKMFESQRFVKDYLQPASPYRGLLLAHSVGQGKCHAYDTEILMSDGKTKRVQEIREGDRVMGDDSTPRTVLSTTQGAGVMYRVTTNFHGVPSLTSTYVVNSDHILCLKQRDNNDNNDTITEISIRDFVALPKDAQEEFLGYRNPVEFPRIEPHVDAYSFGRLLERFGHSTARIPEAYRINHSSVRLAYLAGVIDAAHDPQPCADRYMITLEVRGSIASDLVRICLSLGLAAHASVRTGMMRIVIYGRGIERIPVRRVAKKCGGDDVTVGSVTVIEVNAVGVDEEKEEEYYGFAVDGNHRYMLGDFVVTHNSCAAIVASENFMSSKKIVIMLPASLRGNYMGEIKNMCGNTYFSPNRRWKFYAFEFVTNKIGLKQESALAFYLSDITGIHKSIVAAHRGVWIAEDSSSDAVPYEDLPDAAKDQIRKQLDDIVQRKYTFINYNGLSSQKKMAAFTDPKKNPFDNCVVIVDEVHRFVSMYLNQGKTGVPIYQRLREARDARLILLSGTPVINDPYEAACLMNLVAGPQIEYELALAGGISKDTQKVATYLHNHPHVDIYDMARIPGHAFVRLCPEGYRFSDKSKFRVVPDTHKTTRTKIMDEIATNVGAQKTVTGMGRGGKGLLTPTTYYTAKETDLFPPTADAFREIYVDPATQKIRYESQIQRRMLGHVSHMASTKNFPSVREEFTYLTMTPAMFTIYTEQRSVEIARESKNRLRRKKEGDAADLPETYRVYSRMCCNFVYPEEIVRVYKGESKKARNNSTKGGNANANANANNNNNDLRNASMNDVIVKEDAREEDDESAAAKLEKRKMALLTPAALAQLSPKGAKIIERVRKQEGKVVIYSDFKIMEGIGHVALGLDVQGFKEAIVTYNATTKSFETNVSNKEDKDKPKYFRFRNMKENPGVQVLMDMFNNNLKSVPDNIKTAFGISSNKDDSNIRGKFLKAILITRAAAEGISLKQVREVHVMEPFWNEARIQQVIGRAVRAGSHMDLPEPERNVTVYRYIVQFSQDQIGAMPSLLKNDLEKVKDGNANTNTNNNAKPAAQGKYMTTDVYMKEHSAVKYAAIVAILDIMKSAAVDCAIMNKFHPDVKCLSTASDSEPTYKLDHRQDAFERTTVAVRQKEVVYDYFRECRIDDEKYALDPKKMVLYDLDAYLSGKLLRVGTLVKHGKDAGVWKAKFDA